MPSIRIETIYDDHECETCGSSSAYGARVYLDGELLVDMTPVAHCYDSVMYDDMDIMRHVLEHLGYDVEIVSG